ncbi:hypothetical protein D3C73_986080 [compost metagenome]
MQLDLAGALVMETLVETVDITLQATVTDEKTSALGLPVGRLRSEQIVAHLEPVQRAVEPWRDGTSPGLVEVFPVGPTPARTKGTGFVEQSLVTLSIMEGAERRLGQLRGRRWQYGPDRDFLTVQGNGRCTGFRDRQWRRADGRYRRRERRRVRGYRNRWQGRIGVRHRDRCNQNRWQGGIRVGHCDRCYQDRWQGRIRVGHHKRWNQNRWQGGVRIGHLDHWRGHYG